MFCETAIRTRRILAHASLPTAGRNTASLYPATVNAMVRAVAPQWFHSSAKGDAKECFVLLLCSFPHTSCVRWTFCATGASLLAAMVVEAPPAAPSSFGRCFKWREAGDCLRAWHTAKGCVCTLQRTACILKLGCRLLCAVSLLPPQDERHPRAGRAGPNFLSAPFTLTLHKIHGSPPLTLHPHVTISAVILLSLQ